MTDEQKTKLNPIEESRREKILDFMNTYGWAILATIIAIGVLAYFGVFTPPKPTTAISFCEAHNLTHFFYNGESYCTNGLVGYKIIPENSTNWVVAIGG